jgi:hypothetical protein
VTARRASSDPLFTTTWVHVFEEDTPAGAVYRPEDDDIPLSRRPRERLELDKDGDARVFTSGPDDRMVDHAARWREEDGVLIVRAREGRLELRIVDRSKKRLIVRSGPGRAAPSS